MLSKDTTNRGLFLRINGRVRQKSRSPPTWSQLCVSWFVLPTNVQFLCVVTLRVLFAWRRLMETVCFCDIFNVLLNFVGNPDGNVAHRVTLPLKDAKQSAAITRDEKKALRTFKEGKSHKQGIKTGKWHVERNWARRFWWLQVMMCSLWQKRRGTVDRWLDCSDLVCLRALTFFLHRLASSLRDAPSRRTAPSCNSRPHLAWIHRFLFPLHGKRIFYGWDVFLRCFCFFCFFYTIFVFCIQNNLQVRFASRFRQRAQDLHK